MSMRRHFLVPLCLLLAGVGCSGTNKSGDRVGTVNAKVTILPESPSVPFGQTVQFTASTPWGNEAIWNVLPATAGTITGTGLFTASSRAGKATVFAMWAKDVRYTASTDLTVLGPPAPAEISPNLVQSSGGQQTVPGTNIAHAIVVGEPIPARTVTASNGAITVRHGFNPPVQ